MKKLIDKMKLFNKNYNKFISNKPQKKILQFLPNNIFLFILLVILLISTIASINNNDIINYKTQNINHFANEIVNKPVVQIINIEKINKLEKIGIYFATYKRHNDSNYKFEIYKDDKIIYSKKLNVKNIKDNSYYYFKPNIKKINKRSIYKYKLIPLNVKKGCGITTAMNEKGEYGYILNNKSEFYTEILFLSIVFFLVYFIINYLINNKIINKESKFLILMIIYIIPILFIYPAYETPDEPFHFYKAFRLSQYNISKTPYENMYSKKIVVPSNYNCLGYSRIQEYESVSHKKDINKCFVSPSNTKKRIFKSNSSNILVYIPSAIGIKIMDNFTNSPLLIFYSGRMFNFIISFLLLLYAFKIVPKHKRLFLLIMCSPMFIQQLISYSYDSILNSLSILIIAYLLKFSYTKEYISKKDLIIYTLASICILDIKKPYLLLSLPILFIDQKKFGNNKKEKLKKLLFMLFMLLFSYIMFKYISNIGLIKLSNVKDSLRGNTFSSLFNFKHLLLVVFNTIQHNWSAYFISEIGMFGWLSTPLNKLLIWSYFIIILLTTLSEKSNLTKKFKIKTLVNMLILICGIFLAMYLYWTPTGNTVIEGVQGRYFLCINLLLLLLLIPRKSIIKIDNKTIYSFINISFLIFIITILVSFY